MDKYLNQLKRLLTGDIPQIYMELNYDSIAENTTES